MPPLVDYSDSDDEDTEPQEAGSPPRKKLKAEEAIETNQKTTAPAPPPLPAAFHDLYATNVRISNVDDPTLHGGRKRQTPHVEGNWPTHIYLEWSPNPTQTRILERLIARATAASASSTAPKPHTLLESALGAPQPLHISLSRTLQLQARDRDSFPAALDATLRSAGVRPFEVSFRDVAWFANYERNRWFLSLACEKPGRNELNRVLLACNRVCARWGCPLLYYRRGNGDVSADVEKVATIHGELEMQDCSAAFHISLAYLLETPREEGTPILRWDGEESDELQREMAALRVKFDTVKVKIGNRVTSIDLTKKNIDERRTGGLLD